MRVLTKTAFAALLLGSTVAGSALAAPYTGCPAGYHRAEQEGGGVGSVTAATRRAEQEGGGVGSVTAATRRAEALADAPCIPSR